MGDSVGDSVSVSVGRKADAMKDERARRGWHERERGREREREREREHG